MVMPDPPKKKVFPNLVNAGKGRPKGVPNRHPALARDVIHAAARQLGSAERLAAWVRKSSKNETLFWTVIYPRMLPVEASSIATGGQPLIGVQIISYKEIDDGKTIEARAEESKDPDS